MSGVFRFNRGQQFLADEEKLKGYISNRKYQINFDSPQKKTDTHNLFNSFLKVLEPWRPIRQTAREKADPGGGVIVAV